MPIYSQAYRRYEARAPLRTLRFWPITREALRLILSKRAFLGLLALGFLPFVVRLVQVYVVTRLPEAGRLLPVDGRLFGEFLNQQVGFVILLTIFGGSGLIASDLRSGAILTYLARPLTRRDYVLGKLGVLLVLNLSLTLVPGLALYALSMALAPERFLTWELAWLAPAIVLQSLLLSLLVGLLALALSSLSKSARVAGLSFFGLLVGLEAARGILWVAYRHPATALLSIQGTLRSVGNALFGLHDRGLGLPWGLAVAALGALGLGCLLILRARVRAVEIVR